MRKVIIIVTSIILLTVLFVIGFSWYRVNIRTRTRVNGREYPYQWIEREQKLTEEIFNNFEKGMTYTEIVEKIGRQNGPLNQNYLMTKIYYEIGYNSFIVLEFDDDSPIMYYDPLDEFILDKIYLYDRDGIVKQIM